jgi:DNA-binding GntR family transcriptional regulator
VRLELAPASVIDERKLAEEMELGLTPVRHALRRLALENLVVILPRRGTLVADLNPADLNKIFEMRVELEALAAGLAAQRIAPDQATLLAKLAQETRCAQGEAERGWQAGATERPTPAPLNERLIQLDRRMHRLLAEAAHNEFLLETLEWLYTHVLRLWNTGLPRVTSLDRSMEEHCQVADAVLAGEGARAAALMREHIRHFQQEFLDTTGSWALSAARTLPAGAPIQPQPAALPDVILINTESAPERRSATPA